MFDSDGVQLHFVDFGGEGVLVQRCPGQGAADAAALGALGHLGADQREGVPVARILRGGQVDDEAGAVRLMADVG
jgi:hypothetical protein